MQQLRQLKTKQGTPLYAIKGFACMNAKTKQLAEIAWLAAYTALWHANIISAEDQQQAKDYIKSFLQEADNPEEAYSELVQRVLLARQYIQSAEGRYAPSPAQWFDPANSKGFAGTAAWYKKLQEKRRSMPLFRLGLKAFAEAIQEIVETGAAKDFHYWRSYFIERSWNNLVNLLLATIGNMRFNMEKK